MTSWMEGDWPEDLRPEDERDVMLKKVAKAIRQFSNELPSINDSIDIAFSELEQLADEIEGYCEPNDPRSMGWVGDDGLP